jgi:CubicO group peptidase (beta-lactamase class C family)
LHWSVFDRVVKVEWAVEEVVEQIVNESIDPPGSSGLLIGILKESKTSFFGFGGTSQRRTEPPDEDTIFEIGSVTKVFTASLLSILVADALLSWDDQVRDLLTIPTQLPAEVSLERVATHTAGLPKMPSDLLRAMLKDRNNPYAVYSKDDLFRYLSKFKPSPRRLSKSRVEYSNLGYVLLGLVIEARLDKSYEAALTERLCNPMKLTDTRITLDTEQRTRLATPHSSGGRINQNWELEVFAGAGALRSTGRELLKFLAFNLGDRPLTFQSALEACHLVRTENFPPPGALSVLLSPWHAKGNNSVRFRQGMAFGWMTGRFSSGDERVHWHHGATGGYRAFVGFVKRIGAAVVVLANSAPRFVEGLLSTTSTDTIGFNILENLVTAQR